MKIINTTERRIRESMVERRNETVEKRREEKVERRMCETRRGMINICQENQFEGRLNNTLERGRKIDYGRNTVARFMQVESVKGSVTTTPIEEVSGL